MTNKQDEGLLTAEKVYELIFGEKYNENMPEPLGSYLPYGWKDILKAQLAKDEARFAKEKPLIEKAERDYVISWLDDIFLCEFYDAEKRDELCRQMWQALKSS